jgi:HlyD family secretion protein
MMRVAKMSPKIEEGNVSIKLQFIGPTPLGLRRGQHLSTKLILARHPNLLKVRRGSLVNSSGSKFVYVVDGKRAVRRMIHVGAISTDEVEITDGVHAGEAIVVAGVRDVSKGEISLIR